MLDGNIFLSVFMTPNGPGDTIEVMAWGQVNGTYNYYKFEGGSWRFRNHSTDLDTSTTPELADGSVTVSGLPGLLDSLFWPTELNLGSSNGKSGLDQGGLTQHTTERMNIPDSFFLNIMQMRDISLPTFAGQGLVTEAFTPGDLGLSVAEYEALLNDAGVTTACMPGPDTMFAWFGPEPSEFDRRMVERLNKRGVLDDAFTAAALAVDVENPLFSEARASLLRHVPQSISALSPPLLPDALRTAVISSLENTTTRTAAEEDFMTLLQNADPVAELDDRVQDYLSRTQALLSDPAARGAHLQRLFSRLLVNRKTFQTSEVSRRLNEFPGLLPSN